VIQSVKATGGTGAAVTDAEIVAAIRLLAETEGIFTEPAAARRSPPPSISSGVA